MDIVASDPRSRARAYANLRTQFVDEHNRNVSIQRSSIAKDILSVDESKRSDIAQSKMAADVDEAQQTVGAFIDAGAAARAGKSQGQARADYLAKKVTGKTTGELADSITTSSGESGAKVGEEEAAKTAGGEMNPLAKGAVNAADGLAETGANVGVKAMTKGALKGVGKVALKNAGGIFNIGLGVEAVAEDFKGGHFHLAGNNGLEEASNVLQIGSGVADIIGFAFPPAAALGALMGVASSVAEGLGKREEEEDKEKAIKKQAADAKSKLSAASDSLITMKRPKPPPLTTVSAILTPSVAA